MVLWWPAALCAAGLTNSLKVGLAGVTDYYCKPRLGKLRQTGTIAVWLKPFGLKPMMQLFTWKQGETLTPNGVTSCGTGQTGRVDSGHKPTCYHIHKDNLRVRGEQMISLSVKKHTLVSHNKGSSRQPDYPAIGTKIKTFWTYGHTSQS